MGEMSGPHVAIELQQFVAALEAAGIQVEGPVKAIEFDEEAGTVTIGWAGALGDPE